MKEFVNLAYFIRNFNLTFEDLSSFQIRRSDGLPLVHIVYDYLKDGCTCPIADQKLLHSLCLSLKYLSRNGGSELVGNPLEVLSIAQLIETCNIPHTQSELVALLAYRIKKSSEALSSDQRANMETLVLHSPELNADAKAFS